MTTASTALHLLRGSGMDGAELVCFVYDLPEPRRGMEQGRLYGDD